ARASASRLSRDLRPVFFGAPATVSVGGSFLSVLSLLPPAARAAGGLVFVPSGLPFCASGAGGDCDGRVGSGAGGRLGVTTCFVTELGDGVETLNWGGAGGRWGIAAGGGSEAGASSRSIDSCVIRAMRLIRSAAAFASSRARLSFSASDAASAARL